MTFRIIYYGIGTILIIMALRAIYKLYLPYFMVQVIP